MPHTDGATGVVQVAEPAARCYPLVGTKPSAERGSNARVLLCSEAVAAADEAASFRALGQGQDHVSHVRSPCQLRPPDAPCRSVAAGNLGAGPPMRRRRSGKEHRGHEERFLHGDRPNRRRARAFPREAVLSSVEHALKTRLQEDGQHGRGGRGRHRPDDRRDADFRRADVWWSGSKIRSTRSSLAEARIYAPNPQVGDLIRIERTPENFGRIAAQTAKQVVLQRIRDYERDTVYEEFHGQAGRGAQRHRAARRSARGHRRARQGRGGHARARAGADRALPAGPAGQGAAGRGQQGPARTATDRLPLAPGI